jgi:pilus assembly protein CpaD
MSVAAMRSRAPRVVAPGLTAALASLMLAGCMEHARIDGPTAAALADPAKRHPISFSAHAEALYVEVPDGASGLSGNQATDVIRFLDRYKSETRGPLRIAAPSSPRGHMSVSRSLRQIEDIIDRAGIPLEAVERDRARGRGDSGPAVKLSYERSVAMPPPCGSWPEDLGRVDRDKLPFENFGCATQRNLALTVANARDLQVAQDETPRSSERRSATWTKYVGASTSSAPAPPSAAPASATPTTK